MYRFRDTLPINTEPQTVSGDLVQIDNSDEMGVVDSLKVALEPIQDLNGYDAPWVGGAGKNKANLADGTRTGQGITATVSNQVISASGTATATFANINYFNAISITSGQTYTVRLSKSISNAITFRFATDTTDTTYQQVTIASRSTSATFTANNNFTVFRLYISGLTSGNTVSISGLQVLVGEGNISAFEPYENICPISGRTEVETYRTDEQLYNPSNTEIGKNWIMSADSKRAINVFAVEPNTEYRVVAKGGNFENVLFIEMNNNTQITNFSIKSPFDSFVTTRSSCNTIIIQYQDTADITESNFADYVCSVSKEYAEYTTSLGRTVYGGTLDVVSGVLTVDRAMVDLGTLTLSYDSGNRVFQTGKALGKSGQTGEPTYMVSDRYESMPYGYNSAYADQDAVIWLHPSGTLRVRNLAYTDASAFKQAMSGSMLVYELANPQTYQLTPQQIDLLLGTNHLWSDGEISVVWHKDLTKGRILPTEAVSINGQYIENVLDGYRTLYTKGRESLGAELNTYSVGTADGEKFKNKRYPARELTVGFQLIADNAEDFREKFNNLNNLLSLDEADFIFNDETDKFFSGYPIMNAEVEAGQDSVKGEWKIYCAYPFKRSVEPITLTMEDATVTDTTATFTIDYKGARPARPVLRAKFAGAKSSGTSSEDGDCGFVAFVDQEENIIQLGNPDVLDLDEYTQAKTLINKEFVNISDWQTSGGHTYSGSVTGTMWSSVIADAFWNGGVGQTQAYAIPRSYGSGSGLHGSVLWKNTEGAVNFSLNLVHRICCANPNETGVFECGTYTSAGVMVAGFVIDKSANGTAGVVRYIVNGRQVGSDSIDLSYYNTHFGYCNRTPVYVQQTYYDPVTETYRVQVKTKKKKKKKKKYVTKSRIVWVARTRTVFSNWNYTQSNLNSSIEKEGAYVYIKVGNLPLRTFNVPDITQVVAHDASVFMGTYGTALHTNMIHSLLFRREAGVPFAEQPNVFTAGDIVEADCNEATVNIYRDGSIGGHLEPQYGALGNDWESFMLTSGSNVIRATWSEWVNPTYKPEIEIEYNEVFI